MITSKSNPQIKWLLQLQKKSKARTEEKVFVVEGIRMFAEVPRSRVEKVYLSESFYNKKKEELDLKNFPYEILYGRTQMNLQKNALNSTPTKKAIHCISHGAIS